MKPAPAGAAPQPSKTLLLSDVHLKVLPTDREPFAQFVVFLRGIDPSDFRQVIILGDLFDFWFEYKHVIFSGYFDVLRALADLRDAGVVCHLICGNHDFWAGRFIEQDLAIHVHRDRLTLNMGGRRVLMVHGDGLNPRDLAYRIYKRIARWRPVVALFRVLHPDWAMALARVVSSHSRGAYRDFEPGDGPEAASLREFARQTLAAGQADVVVCGHSHHPVIEQFPTPNGTGLYINTGDWHHHRSYVTWDGDDFALAHYR